MIVTTSSGKQNSVISKQNETGKSSLDSLDLLLSKHGLLSLQVLQAALLCTKSASWLWLQKSAQVCEIAVILYEVQSHQGAYHWVEPFRANAVVLMLAA